MQLLVDIGNSRIKWALWDGGRASAHGSAAHRDDLDGALAALTNALPRGVTRVLTSNVAGSEAARRLTAAIRAHFGVDPEFVAVAAEQFGVTCGYSDPSRLGVDRWLAVLAARQSTADPACVISAGTAVTFDAVDAGGRHLGGLIFAGARLAADALDAQTSGIGATPLATEPPAGLALLGRNTGAAVGHGAMLALAAACDRAVRTVADALGARPTVYITGGDAAALARWLETPTVLRADLVLEGLALFAGAPDAAGSRA